MRRLVPIALLAAGVMLAASACSGSSSPSTAPATARGAPDLAALLAQPIATPSSCPANVNGTTVGRTSPWQGTVDISVFLRNSATPAQIKALSTSLHHNPLVKTTYFESKKQAYEEFQRLYTCSNSVHPSATPASYRIVLEPTVTIAERDRLVGVLTGESAVDGVSCDASLECLAVLGSGSPTPSSSTTR